MHSSSKKYELVDSVASRLEGFQFGTAPASLIDTKALVAASIKDFEPQLDAEIFSLVTHAAGKVRSTKTYRQFQQEYSKPCWSLVTSSAVHIVYDATPLSQPNYKPLLTACSYPHLITNDPWIAMQQFANGKSMSLDKRLVEALTPRAINVFGQCGKMIVEGGSDLISPQRYTIFANPNGGIDPGKVATGLARMLADNELQAIYDAVLKENQHMLKEMRAMNPTFFTTPPAFSKKDETSRTYFQGDPSVLH